MCKILIQHASFLVTRTQLKLFDMDMYPNIELGNILKHDFDLKQMFKIKY